ncbi:asparagine synthase (glutamine-hydrolyzing) [Magnetococcales bacterium HHB-1]
MCGLCGFALADFSVEVGNQRLHQMLTQLEHRGPDQKGVWSDHRIALGHQRLAILDLAQGRQPMQGAAGNVIVFNGEIYNYKEIRQELEELGETFQEAGDTEVLLKAWEVWGEESLKRFVGMFSFIIYNPKAKKLYLARDPLGKKPLFYAHYGKHFIFASEIKSLLYHPVVKEQIDIRYKSLVDFLSLGYIQTPHTIFSSIYKLPAGYFGTYCLDTNTLKTAPYFSLREPFLLENKQRNHKNLSEDFLNLLSDAVNIRLRSDVPLGAFLSGGLDSSAILERGNNLLKDDASLKALCVGFSEKSYDESNYARLVAEHLGSELTPLQQHHPSKDELSKIVWHCDEPFADTSIIPTYLMNREAKQFITVALSGDGADELLAGYPTLAADQLFARYTKITPEWMQFGFKHLAEKWLKPSYKKVSFDYKLRRFLQSAGMSPQKAHYWWRSYFSRAEVDQILSPDVAHEVSSYDSYSVFKNYFNETSGMNTLDAMLYVDFKTWLQDDILVKVDRMSMAHALEVRSPFLDHRLVEFAAKLPVQQKISGTKQKVILKQSMKARLPQTILSRSKKGFNFPAHTVGLKKITTDPALFSTQFALNPEKEDITFKSFALRILSLWLDIYQQYQRTGAWRPVSYGKND